jgi:hypothetical protein
MIEKIKKIVKNPYFILMIVIVALSSFLRFYGNNLDHKFHFTNDEARDASIILDSVIKHKPIVLGPEITSIGGLQAGVHLGPFYYYLLFIALFIGGFAPFAGQIMIIIFSIASTALIYFVGKKYFNNNVGLISAVVFALSKILIEYTWAWNPNPLPFFVLLYLYFAYEFFVNKKDIHWILLCITLGLMTQLHLVASIFLITTIIIFTISKVKFNKIRSFYFGIMWFLLTYLPFIAYELTHNFKNLRGYWDIVFGGSGASSEKIFNFDRSIGLFSFFMNDFFTSQKSMVLTLIILFGIFFYLFKDIKKFSSKIILITFTLLFLFISKLQNMLVFWHYILPFLPLLILAFANFLHQIYINNKSIIIKVIPLVILVVFVRFNYLTYISWINDYYPTHPYDIKYKNISQVVNYISNDSNYSDIQLIYTNYPTQNDKTYEYLFRLKRVKVVDASSQIYVIAQPKDSLFELNVNSQIIKTQIIGDVKVIKLAS